MAKKIGSNPTVTKVKSKPKRNVKTSTVQVITNDIVRDTVMDVNTDIRSIPKPRRSKNRISVPSEVCSIQPDVDDICIETDKPKLKVKVSRNRRIKRDVPAKPIGDPLNPLTVGHDIVYKWLGVEKIGILESTFISTADGTVVYVVDGYPCRMTSKFGVIMLDKTIELQAGKYIKETKTDIDYAMEDLTKSWDTLNELHAGKFPKKKHKEFKELIKTMKTQLMELQKLVITK